MAEQTNPLFVQLVKCAGLLPKLSTFEIDALYVELRAAMGESLDEGLVANQFRIAKRVKDYDKSMAAKASEIRHAIIASCRQPLPEENNAK